MIVLTGCYSETDPASNSAEPQMLKQAPEQTEPSLGLTFGGIGSPDQGPTDPWDGEWEKVDIQTSIDILKESADFEPPVVDTSQIEKPLHWLSLEETKPNSNDRAVLQALSILLNYDRLKIKYLGASDRGLKYHVQCKNFLYLVEYDLKTVHIINVIK